MKFCLQLNESPLETEVVSEISWPRDSELGSMKDSFSLITSNTPIYTSHFCFFFEDSFVELLKVIDFILSERRIDVCNSNLEVRCYDLNAVFGDLEVNSVERLIQHSTQIVEQLELECPRVLFATYYMTLDGKASKLL